MRRATTTATAIVLIASCGICACATILGGDFDDKRPETLTTRDDDGGSTSSSSSSSSSSSGSTSSSSGSSDDDGGGSSGGTSGGTSGTSGGTSSGGSKTCQGTSAACATLASNGECTTQQGCAWSMPRCQVTSPCDTQISSSACQMLAGCDIDLTVPGGTNPCQPIPGYCTGTTKAACESKQACRFTGGCTGTATGCSSINIATTCAQQEGCTWQ